MPTSRRLALADRMNPAEADLNPIPSVDRDDQQGELHLLLFGELGLQRPVIMIRRARLRYQGQRFGPRQRSPLTLAIERRFTPRIEQIKTLLALALFAGIGGVHVQAARTAVD